MKKIYDLLFEGEYVDYKDMKEGRGFKAVPGENYYIFAGGTKPFHAGHDQMIMHAINDAKQDPNGRALLYIGLGDRGPIKGNQMYKVWQEIIEPYYTSISPNIVIEYAGGPVGKVLSLLQSANIIAGTGVRPDNMFYIYSDPEDTQEYYLLPKYSAKDPTVELKSSPPMYSSHLRNMNPPGVSFMGVDYPDRFTRGGEGGTLNISGTKMREYLETGDINSFMNGLPAWMGPSIKQNVYQSLSPSLMEIKRSVKGTKEYSTYLEDVMNELQHIKKEYGSRTKEGSRYRKEASIIQNSIRELNRLKKDHERKFEDDQMLSERLIRRATGYDDYEEKDETFNRNSIRDFFNKFK